MKAKPVASAIRKIREPNMSSGTMGCARRAWGDYEGDDAKRCNGERRHHTRGCQTRRTRLDRAEGERTHGHTAVTCPAQSRGAGRRGAIEARRTTRSAAAPTGTLMKKMRRQSK